MSMSGWLHVKLGESDWDSKEFVDDRIWYRIYENLVYK